jgi:hypothetical protein
MSHGFPPVRSQQGEQIIMPQIETAQTIGVAKCHDTIPHTGCLRCSVACKMQRDLSEALEHYILVNPATELDKQRLLYFLQLYRTESSKALDQTADILKSALASNWGGQ